MGDDLDVRYEDWKILLEKLEDNWEKVMAETEGSWAKHPVFGRMKNSVEIVHLLRQTQISCGSSSRKLWPHGRKSS